MVGDKVVFSPDNKITKVICRNIAMVTFKGVDKRPPLPIDTDANCAVRRFLCYRSAISRVQLVILEFAA